MKTKDDAMAEKTASNEDQLRRKIRVTKMKCDSKITSLAFLMFDLCGHIYLIKDSSNGYFTGSPSSNKRMETISIIDPTMAFRLKIVCAIVSGKRLIRVTRAT